MRYIYDAVALQADQRLTAGACWHCWCYDHPAFTPLHWQ